MFASSNCFTALPLLRPRPLVSRWIVIPPTETSVAACTFATTGDGEVICTVQEPVPPAVVQVFGPTKLAGGEPLTNVKVITVPSGAFTNPPPRPAFTFT